MLDDATEGRADDLSVIIDGSPMRTNGKRILIVEDDLALAIKLRDAFKAEGAVVLGPAPTVFYARHLIGRRGIDCAVVSGDLPGNDGEHFLAQLASSGTPVITLSGGTTSVEANTRVIARPVEAKSVVDSVAALLNAHPDDNRPIELKSERAFKALGLADNPHMRVVRIWTESMRRQADEQKQGFL
jgi:DNA-binding NtrC family response regulator